MREIIEKKLGLLTQAFRDVLYKDDTTFLENMKTKNLIGDDINRYRFWEWTQGVGLFGFWKMFEVSHDEKHLEVLLKYYDEQIEQGLPAKNINTVAPLLALAYVYEYTQKESYLEVCTEWAKWIMESLPRTQEGGFQHITSDTLNEEELWDDTLFMTVLFLAKMGKLLEKKDYVEEAKYQFLLHIKYLTDRKTGLWFHGWSFNERHNFVEALWGRGNCWITIAIPEFIACIELEKGMRRFLIETLKIQIDSLLTYQNETGMWHTLVDDPTSYVEASATCGFAYGILKAVEMEIIDASYQTSALRALIPILEYITDKGTVEQVSYGTAMGRESKEFYKDIPIQSMPYGQALAMLFLIQTLKMKESK